MKLSWSKAETPQGTRSGGVAEYRRRPVLQQELKGKEEKECKYSNFNIK